MFAKCPAPEVKSELRAFVRKHNVATLMDGLHSEGVYVKMRTAKRHRGKGAGRVALHI